MLLRTGKPGEGEQLQRFEVDMRVRAFDEKKRTAELSFSSETPVRRWFGSEILVHDPGCVDFSRINDIGVGLFNHRTDYVLGPISDGRLDGKTRRGLAVLTFDDDEEADKIFRKVINRTLKGVSVGYRVDVWEEVTANATSTNGRFTGPCYLATRWTPMEISIVSVPADASVGVGRSDGTQVDAFAEKRARDLHLIALRGHYR